LAAQGHLQQVFLDAGFDGFAQLGGNFKEAVSRAKTFNALVRPLVVVIFDPQTNAIPGRVETCKLRPGQELLPDRFPEPLDFAQRHRVMRPAFEVSDAALFEFSLEAGSPAPGCVLAAIVGEHLFGQVILAQGGAEHFQNIFGSLAAKHISADHEPRIIVHEADQVGVATAQPEGEDVRLPHLIGSGAFKKAGADQIAPWLGWRLNQTLLLQRFANRLRAGGQKEHPLKQLGDPPDAPGGFFLFEFQDLLPDRFGQSRPMLALSFVLQSLFTILSIQPHPFAQSGNTDSHLLGHHLLGEAFLQLQFDGLKPFLERSAKNFSPHCPPRGAGVLSLLRYRFILFHVTLLYH
jgi:hypothetical protein